VGCGTSWFMAMAYAALREDLGLGETDAFAGSEFPSGRSYDVVVVISRSGTTTEVLELIRTTGLPTVAITATAGTPIFDLADQTILLDFADEQSVVQTRFATTALLVLRASLGEELSGIVADARAALDAPLPASWVDADQISFLGTGWTIGLAHEAALKLRESSQSWTESYPAMEYRHGPIAIAQSGRLIWVFGNVPGGLAEQVAASGAELVTSELDPLAHLVHLHQLALARAEARGLDADRPRSLTRSVILSEQR